MRLTSTEAQLVCVCVCELHMADAQLMRISGERQLAGPERWSFLWEQRFNGQMTTFDKNDIIYSCDLIHEATTSTSVITEFSPTTIPVHLTFIISIVAMSSKTGREKQTNILIAIRVSWSHVPHHALHLIKQLILLSGAQATGVSGRFFAHFTPPDIWRKTNKYTILSRALVG